MGGGGGEGKWEGERERTITFKVIFVTAKWVYAKPRLETHATESSVQLYMSATKAS